MSMEKLTLENAPVLLGTIPDAAAVKAAAADVVAAAEKAAVASLKGEALAPLLAAVAEGPDPVVVVPLAKEDPQYLEGLLQHAAPWAAGGIALAAKACGAGQVVLYAVLAEQAGALAAAVKDMGFAGEVTVVTGPGSLVLREESALYAALDGKPIRSELLDKAFPTQGWQGRSTLVLGLETAARLCAAVTGAPAPGKLMLLSLMGPDAAPVFAEVALDSPLAAVAGAAGLPAEKPLLLGGLTGRFVAGDGLELEKTAYTEDFSTLRAFAPAACMADVGRVLTKDIEEMSCGKCVLCREGSWQYKAMFQDITEGRGKKTDFELVPDIGELIAAGAFCGYGRDMVRLPISLMALCRTELEAHVVRKTCPAGVCAHFNNYVIDPALCTGCEECLDACPEDAIEGKDGFIHMIDEDMCTKCGKCVPACPETAICIATGRIKVPKKLTRVGKFK